MSTYGTLNADLIGNSNGQTGNAIGPGFKNRIINGDMRIDQRNAGASVTLPSGGLFPVDRFQGFEATDGEMTAQQDTSAPAGFVNSLKFTTTTADGTLTTTQNVQVGQRIEGNNVSDLAWGTANAKTVTLSFWVRSSLTGTFGGSLRNSALDRSYPFNYTISVADTWEYKTVTVPGDTSGTWGTTNGTGILLTFGLGVGPDRSGTAGAWAGANYISSTGAVSVIGTLNATWYITGVQLEVGPSATSFDYRPYGTELNLCQRYFQKTDVLGTGIANTGTGIAVVTSFIQPMRATPTSSVAGTTWNMSDNYSADATATSPSIAVVYNSSATSIRYQLGGFTGLTTGRWYGYMPSTTSLIAFSAEL